MGNEKIYECVCVIMKEKMVEYHEEKCIERCEWKTKIGVWRYARVWITIK